MSLRYSIATGNFTSAATWGLVDATSHSNSETANSSLTTSYAASAGTTTGVIIVLGVALKMATRTGTTGTMSVRLATGGVLVPGAEVTINVADLPVGSILDLNGGWHYFKFASPVALAAATSYTVDAKSSSNAQVSLFTASGQNWSRCLVTTTTGAPAAGDDWIIGGEYVSAGVSNSFVVTMNETATTDYGAASTSLVTPAAAICNKGTLLWGTTAATNYYLKISGHFIEYSGGTHIRGGIGAECPRDSTQKLHFDIATNVEFGRTSRNLCIISEQGLSRTVGNNSYYCKLNTDEAVNSTSLGVDADCGWLDNDEIAIASTTRTNTQAEQGTMNGAAGASTLTVDGFAGAGGGLAFAHSGVTDTPAEVILLTRNVQMFGTSVTLQTYWDIKATAAVDCDWAEYKWMGSATANKRGIDTACTTGSQNFQYCSFHNFEVTGSRGLNMGGASGTGFTFQNNVTYQIANEHLVILLSSGTWVVDSNIFMRNITASIAGVSLSDIGGTFTNNVVTSMTGVGISTADAGTFGTWSGNTVHSVGNIGINVTNILQGGIISSSNVWRNGGAGLTWQAGEFTIDGIIAFGNGTSNITNSAGSFRVVLINPILNGDTSFATTNGILMGAVTGGGEYIVYNGNFGTASGIKTAHTNDISWGSATIQPYGKIHLFNSIFASPTFLLGQANMSPNSIITLEDRTIKKYGTFTHETTTVPAGATDSLKITPINASFKSVTIGERGGFTAPILSGQTCTPSIHVREDASYNGARSRLWVKRNDRLGISSDALLDTATAASDGAFETLTGTTAAVTDDGVLEFYVDCDGTAGNLFVGNFSAINT